MICVRDCGSIVGPSKSARRAQLKTESKMKCVLLAPGSQNRTTIAKKSIQNTIIFMMRLGINFRTGFGGSSRPKWNQVGTKINQKSTKIIFLGRLEIVSGPPEWHLGTLGLGLIFGRLLAEVRGQNGTKLALKYTKKARK